MRYRTLGSTGLNVSVIGIGTWQLGGEWGKEFSQDEVSAMIHRGKELGINLIDTAECYGDHVSERLVGNAIEKDRGDWIVATKFGHTYTGHLQRAEPRSPDDVRKQLEDSLKALRTDYIDVYQYHSWGDDQFDDRGVLDVLHNAKRAGKILHIGNSVRAALDLHQIKVAKERGIEVIQLVYNRLDRRPEEQALPICREQNLGVLARVPLASGFLSGKYKPGVTFPKSDVRARQDQAKRDEKIAEAQRIAMQEAPTGMEMATWALAWCLKDPVVSAVIPGCKDVQQVEANARAGDVAL